MLSSPVDAEALAGCRALGRFLAESRLDWHWVADTLEAAWPTMIEPKPQPERNPRRPWQAQAEDLLRNHRDVLGMRGNRMDEKLRAREIDFLSNVRRSKFSPSAQQLKWIGDIESRIRRAA
jgi:hypothetical protein